MATKDTVVQELVVNTLTHKQFKAAQEAGTLSPYELYGTPDTSVRLPVLTPMWFDHITNDVSWLRADTFSWQSGDVYVAAYEHLFADFEGTTADTETIGDITIAFYRAEDGHKICLPDQEANVSALYEATGVAWYYILDTDNKQFKLPRVNANKELLLTDVAPVVTLAEEHLTVGAPTLTWQQSDGTPANYQQYFTLSIGGTPSNGTRTSRQDGSNATGKSGISPSNLYADLNASRTLFGGKRHLYFYVGNFTQDSVEQTAGINAELFNNKADVDLGNIPANYDYVVETQLPAADNGYTWYRKYKSGWVEQGGELSGRSVTFPVEFAQIPTLVFGDYSSNSTSTPQNTYDEITTTGFTGWRTRTNAGWDSGAEDWNGYWQASGMSAQ